MSFFAVRRDDRQPNHARFTVDVDFSNFTLASFRKTLPPYPTPHTPIAQRSFEPLSSYAFVEFRSTRDAEDAYNDMYVFFL